MFANYQQLTRDKCLAKCGKLLTCAMAEYHMDTRGRHQCMMKDVACSEASLISKPGVKNFLRLSKSPSRIEFHTGTTHIISKMTALQGSFQ